MSDTTPISKKRKSTTEESSKKASKKVKNQSNQQDGGAASTSTSSSGMNLLGVKVVDPELNDLFSKSVSTECSCSLLMLMNKRNKTLAYELSSFTNRPHTQPSLYPLPNQSLPNLLPPPSPHLPPPHPRTCQSSPSFPSCQLRNRNEKLIERLLEQRLRGLLRLLWRIRRLRSWETR